MASKGAIVAGEAVVILGVDMTPLQRTLQAAGGLVQSFGSRIAKIGGVLAGMGGAITAPFLGSLSAFMDWGKEIDRGARILGTTRQGFVDMQGAVGATADELIHANTHMGVFINSARTGVPAATAELERLGVTVNELNGMTSEDRFLRLAGAIGSIGDASQRLAIQRTIFGRGATDLNLAGGSEGMQARIARSREVNGLVNPTDVGLAKEASKAFKEMKSAIASVWREVGAVLAPTMLSVWRVATDIVIQVREWVSANRPLLTTVAQIALAVATVGSIIAALGGGLVTVGGILLGIKAAIAFLAPVLMPVIAVVGSITAAVVGLWATMEYFDIGWIDIWHTIVDVAQSAWDTIKAGAEWAWNGIITIFNNDLVKRIFGGLAIAATIIAAPFITVGAYIYELVTDSEKLEELWNHISFALGVAWDNLVAFYDTLRGTLAYLIAWVTETGSSLFDSLLPNATGVAHGIYGVFSDAFGNMASALGNSFSDTFSRIGSMFGGLVGTAQSAWGGITDAFAAGDLAQVWEIVQIAAQLAWQQILEGAEGIWVNLKFAALTVFEEMRHALVEGFYTAWTEVRIIAEQVWERIKQFVFPILQRMLSAAAQAAAAMGQDEASTRLSSLAGNMALPLERLQARLDRIRATAERENAEARHLSGEGGLSREAQHNQRVADLEAQLEEERAGAGRGPEINRLQTALETANLEASYARFFADIERGRESVTAPGEVAGAKGHVAGTFSGAALRGFAGASSPEERTASASERSLAAAMERNRILREILAGLGIRFA